MYWLKHPVEHSTRSCVEEEGSAVCFSLVSKCPWEPSSFEHSGQTRDPLGFVMNSSVLDYRVAGLQLEFLPLPSGFALSGRMCCCPCVGVFHSTADLQTSRQMFSKTSVIFDPWGTPFVTCPHPLKGLFPSLFLFSEQILYSRQDAHASPIPWWCSILNNFWCGNLSTVFLSFVLLLLLLFKSN